MGEALPTIKDVPTSHMKNPTIAFIQSGKGGVGKTFTSANLSSMLNHLEVKHALFSVEIHGHLLRWFHPNTVEIVLDEVAIEQADEALDPIFDAAAKDRRHVVVDTGANTGRGLASWILPTDFFQECAEAKVRVAMVIVVGSADRDSVAFFADTFELAGTKVDWYLVRAWHTGGDFGLFDPIVSKAKARVIDLPVVPTMLMSASNEHRKTVVDLAAQIAMKSLRKARFRTIAREFEAAFQPLVERSFL